MSDILSDYLFSLICVVQYQAQSDIVNDGYQAECPPMITFFSSYVFDEPVVHFHYFLLCCLSQRSARSQVPYQVATHQEIGSQLWAGETPDLKMGLQDNSLAGDHWATMPPTYDNYQYGHQLYNLFVIKEQWNRALDWIYFVNLLW